MNMVKTEILVVGTHPQILQTILRLINKEESWNATGAADVAEALSLFNRQKFDLVLVGAGLSQREEDALVDQLAQLKPAIPVVKHYGGGSGLLYAEIFEGLKASR